MDLRTKLGNARKRKAKLDAREARMGLYRLLDEQVCVAIYLVSGYDMGLAIRFVQQGLLGRGAKSKERIG